MRTGDGIRLDLGQKTRSKSGVVAGGGIALAAACQVPRALGRGSMLWQIGGYVGASTAVAGAALWLGNRPDDEKIVRRSDSISEAFRAAHALGRDAVVVRGRDGYSVVDVRDELHEGKAPDVQAKAGTVVGAVDRQREWRAYSAQPEAEQSRYAPGRESEMRRTLVSERQTETSPWRSLPAPWTPTGKTRSSDY